LSNLALQCIFCEHYERIIANICGAHFKAIGKKRSVLFQTKHLAITCNNEAFREKGQIHFNESVLGFKDISMSESEEQYQQSSDFPTTGYEAQNKMDNP
jgi:hypothetical protein